MIPSPLSQERVTALSGVNCSLDAFQIDFPFGTLIPLGLLHPN